MEFEKLKSIIAGVLNVDVMEITEDTTFVEDLGADSLDLYQIVLEIEEEFDIGLDDESTQNITTVGEAAAVIRRIVGS